MRYYFKTVDIIVCAVFISCSSSSVKHDEWPLSNVMSGKDTCDDPDADVNCSFLNMPENISEVVIIAGEKEQGERLNLSGRVYKEDGVTPYKNVIMYFYHTDSKGVYSKTGNETGVRKWQGRLHGWCKTNADGKYEIQTIRPASYPGTTGPAHIHCVIKLPTGQEPFYVQDFVFDDDPFVDEQFRAKAKQGAGHGVIVKLLKNDKVWHGVRNFVMDK